MLGVGEAVGSTVGVAVGSCWLAVARARPWLAVTYPSTTRAPATVITAATPATPRPMRRIWFIAGLLLHRPSRPSIGMAVTCCGRSMWLTTTLDCGSGTTVERRWSNDGGCVQSLFVARRAGRDVPERPGRLAGRQRDSGRNLHRCSTDAPRWFHSRNREW